MFDCSFLAHHYEVFPRVFCTQLASQLLDAGPNLHTRGFHSLASVLEQFLDVHLDKTEQRSDWSIELTRKQLVYAARDVVHLLALHAVLEKELREQGLDQVMALECAALPVLVDMRLRGVPLDVVACRNLADEKRRISAEARARVEATLQIENAGSWQQLLKALHEIPDLEDLDATNAEALAPYRTDHTVVNDIAVFRAEKTTADFAEGLPVWAEKYPDGRVRPEWHQLAAPTGRMSTSEPNLLGLPKGDAMRACVVAPPGRALIVADYAQIELRILAHVTEDTMLTEIFVDGRCPHRELAAGIADKPIEEITSEERTRAKAINFGFVYGMGLETFIRKSLKDYKVSFSVREAHGFKRDYLRAYPQVRRWQERTRVRMVSEIRTASGRLRRFPSRRDGYTDRLNTPIQGSGADGMKRAMVLLHPQLAAFGAFVILAVHDELVVEAPLEHAEAVKALVERAMREGMEEFITTIPIVVEADVRRTWAKGT
jgi:DNA polymerase-1